MIKNEVSKHILIKQDKKSSKMNKIDIWESWLIRKLIDEEVNWWESWLIRKSICEKVDWWESQIMIKLIDEKVNS